jgi:hypothetical protein
MNTKRLLMKARSVVFNHSEIDLIEKRSLPGDSPCEAPQREEK